MRLTVFALTVLFLSSATLLSADSTEDDATYDQPAAEVTSTLADTTTQVVQSAQEQLNADMNKLNEIQAEKFALTQQQTTDVASTIDITEGTLDVKIAPPTTDPAPSSADNFAGVDTAEDVNLEEQKSNLDQLEAEAAAAVAQDSIKLAAALKLETAALTLKDDFVKLIYQHFIVEPEDAEELQAIQEEVEKLKSIQNLYITLSIEQELTLRLQNLEQRIFLSQPETLCHLSHILKVESEVVKCSIPNWKPSDEIDMNSEQMDPQPSNEIDMNPEQMEPQDHSQQLHSMMENHQHESSVTAVEKSRSRPLHRLHEIIQQANNQETENSF
jgi:hypothetical protein